MRSLLIAVLLVSACGKGDQPPPPTSGSPGAKPESGPRPGGAPGGEPVASDAAGEARKMFITVCAMCHGTDGTGNGPAAENLDPKPRNYTDPAWQASVTDDEIKKIIVEGGQAVGKSAMMPAQTQLKDRPEVVDALVKLIRSFGQQP